MSFSQHELTQKGFINSTILNALNNELINNSMINDIYLYTNIHIFIHIAINIILYICVLIKHK